MKYMYTFLSLTLLSGPVFMVVAHGEETVQKDATHQRITIRDRGTHKALINDKGEKIGYGVRRGDSWTYFVDGSRYTVTEDE